MKLIHNFTESSIVIGCNYHTKWQTKPQMRFVLEYVFEDRAKISTKTTGKCFWTNISDLIFILSDHNIKKAIKLSENYENR